MEKIAEGSQTAFRDLFEKYSGSLLGYCQRLLSNQSLAEEVTQEVWMKVIKLAPNYKAEGHFKAWLFTMARNTCFNQLRSQKNFNKYSESIKAEALSPKQEENLEEFFESKETMESLKMAVDQLPDNQRAAIVLWLGDEMDYQEISKELDLSLSATKSLLFRAKKSIEAMVGT